jgi:hypothetical protein
LRPEQGSLRDAGQGKAILISAVLFSLLHPVDGMERQLHIRSVVTAGMIRTASPDQRGQRRPSRE